MTNKAYALEMAKQRSAEEMDTVRVFRLSKPGRVHYELTFTESSLIAEEGETVELAAVYHNGRCLEYRELRDIISAPRHRSNCRCIRCYREHVQNGCRRIKCPVCG
jgi:hypothetical protein